MYPRRPYPKRFQSLLQSRAVDPVTIYAIFLLWSATASGYWCLWVLITFFTCCLQFTRYDINWYLLIIIPPHLTQTPFNCHPRFLRLHAWPNNGINVVGVCCWYTYLFGVDEFLSCLQFTLIDIFLQHPLPCAHTLTVMQGFCADAHG